MNSQQGRGIKPVPLGDFSKGDIIAAACVVAVFLAFAFVSCRSGKQPLPPRKNCGPNVPASPSDQEY